MIGAKLMLYIQVKQLYEKKMKISQIAKTLGLSRPTVRKYLSMSFEEAEDWSHKQGKRKKILDEYQEWILEWLREYPHLSSAQVKDWLLERFPDLKVGDSTVRLYVTHLREVHQIPKQESPRQYQAVPELPMGQQIQVDWGESTQKTDKGTSIKLYVMCFILSHSRYKYMYWLDRPFTTQDAIRGHELAFQYFGGRTEEIVYDQDRIISVSENAGDLILTCRFQQYVNERGFKVSLCRAADPESKGKIESMVKYVKQNFADSRVYSNLDNWNKRAIRWLERTGNEKKHEVTKKRPREVFATEKEYLIQIPHLNTFPDVINTSITRKISKDNTVMYKSNRYSVPLGTYGALPHNQCLVSLTDEELSVIHPVTQEVIATHKLNQGKGALIQKKSHCRDKNRSSQHLKESLLKQLQTDTIATRYVKTVCKNYPRYQIDQLTMIQSVVDDDINIAIKGIHQCDKLNLYSANDLRLMVQSLKQREASERIDIDGSSDNTMRDTYYVTTRPMSIYTDILKGSEHK